MKLGKSTKPRRSQFNFAESAFALATSVMAWVVVILIFWIVLRLYLDSSISRHLFGWRFLSISVWDEVHGIYGALPFIYGTIVTSVLALIIAAPIGVGTAAFLSEICERKIGEFLSFFIELLAAIPSIVYGLWALFVLCPFLSHYVYGPLQAALGWVPLFSGFPIPTNLFAAGIILSLMVLPYITAISYQVLKTIPKQQRRSALGLGATRWETIRHVILPQATSGITGAVILAFGRAVGETMAVALIVGSQVQVKASLLQPGYTMPALLANQFSEAFNQPIQRSALLEIGFILFVFTFLINAIARLFLVKVRNRMTSKNGSKESEILREKAGAFWSLVGRGIGLIVLVAIFITGLKAQTVLGFIIGVFGPVLIGVVLAVPFIFNSPTYRHKLRRTFDRIWNILLALSTLVGLVGLAALFLFVAVKGSKDFNLNLFTKLPGDPTEAGTGILNAIVGTLYTVGIGSAIGVPIGLLGGVYLSEFSKGPIGQFIKFCSDVLNGIPSVVIGLFAYGAFVLPFGHFSSWAAGGALAVMVIPTVLRTTEDMLNLVPNDFRTASLGLGVTKSQTICFVVIPTASRGIITGVMLAVARIAGETAPLLFTAYGVDQLQLSLDKPIGTITLLIYQYANSPFDNWNNQAWSAALVLLLFVFILSLGAKLLTRKRFA